MVLKQPIKRGPIGGPYLFPMFCTAQRIVLMSETQNSTWGIHRRHVCFTIL